MKIKTVSYGRTVALGEGTFKQDKVWFGYEAELDEGESVDDAIQALRAAADDWEKNERDEHTRRRLDREETWRTRR